MNCFPVCGEVLQISDQLNNMIHLTLCFNEGTGNQVMAGGFLTDKQASYGWFFNLSEWVHFSSYDIRIQSGSSSSHILYMIRSLKGLLKTKVIMAKPYSSSPKTKKTKGATSLVCFIAKLRDGEKYEIDFDPDTFQPIGQYAAKFKSYLSITHRLK
ncbi:phosphatidylserine decarboxylase proenzyme 2-like isoform X2 [Vicia villosa]|uniref:phosphatidylserine decarboxylase proenzyme 2-like isoform X2 n=1 Tax=Vicia villosa TaxID=3911 RepID=UPI00273BFAEF|nr:phosphatidylserine decarboxylase proenzyme 2-like isoform X2 [Vicia villosa]